MNDAERLDELRAKLRRINGHKELSPKQELAARKLVREIVAYEGIHSAADLFAKLGWTERIG